MSNATLPPSLDTLLGALGRQLQGGVQTGPDELKLAALPPALAMKTRAHLLDGELLLIADTSAVAQMLRFHGPRLAKEAGATSFTVRVQTPAEPVHRPSSLTAPELGAEAASILDDAARHCDYAPLAEALARLAALGLPDNDKSDPKG
ncbi:MAG: hypothetical protein ACK4SX_09810 [Alcanivoracaceae bacterium]